MKTNEESADSENEPWNKKLLKPKTKDPWRTDYPGKQRFSLSQVFESNNLSQIHCDSFIGNQTFSTMCPDMSILNALDESVVFNSENLGLKREVLGIPEKLLEEQIPEKKKKKSIFKKIGSSISNLFKRKKKKKNKPKPKPKPKSKSKSKKKKSGRKINIRTKRLESFLSTNHEDTRNIQGVDFRSEEIFQNG